jgi:hypothetical protein
MFSSDLLASLGNWPFGHAHTNSPFRFALAQQHQVRNGRDHALISFL